MPHKRHPNESETIAWYWMHEICGYQRMVFCSRMTHIKSKRTKTQKTAEAKEEKKKFGCIAKSLYIIERMRDTPELIQKEVRKSPSNLLFTAQIVAFGVQCFQNRWNRAGAHLKEDG